MGTHDASLGGRTTERIKLGGVEDDTKYVAIKVIQKGSLPHRLHQVGELFRRRWATLAVEGDQLMFVNINSLVKRTSITRQEVLGKDAAQMQARLATYMEAKRPVRLKAELQEVGNWTAEKLGVIERELRSDVKHFVVSLAMAKWGDKLYQYGAYLEHGLEEVSDPEVTAYIRAHVLPEQS